jgi:hypothetical protein
MSTDSKGTCASERVFLAREICWPSVFSGTRNARAISAAVRLPPPKLRSDLLSVEVFQLRSQQIRELLSDVPLLQLLCPLQYPGLPPA